MKVLSYPQYCRFRSLQRRILERARAPGLQDPHLLALGGVRALPDTRLMYCRDTFSHPALESSAEFSWQFSESGPVQSSHVRGSSGFEWFIGFFFWSVLVRQGVPLSVSGDDLARGGAKTTENPQHPASQSPGSRG